MQKKTIIILPDGFEEIEAISVIDILRRGGVKVDICGLDKLSIKASRGINIKADEVLDMSNTDYDALILPGGGDNALALSKDERINRLLKDFNDKGRLIASICASPAIVLSPTGILDNKKATCYPGMENNFSKSIKFTDEDVVIDGNIITSKGPGTAISFGLKILEYLSGTSIREKIEKAILYKD